MSDSPVEEWRTDLIRSSTFVYYFHRNHTNSLKDHLIGKRFHSLRSGSLWMKQFLVQTCTPLLKSGKDYNENIPSVLTASHQEVDYDMPCENLDHRSHKSTCSPKNEQMKSIYEILELGKILFEQIHNK